MSHPPIAASKLQKDESSTCSSCDGSQGGPQLRSIFLFCRIKSPPASIYCHGEPQFWCYFGGHTHLQPPEAYPNDHIISLLPESFYLKKLIYKFFYELFQDSVKNRIKKNRRWRNWFGCLKWGYFRKKLKLRFDNRARSTSPWLRAQNVSM